MSSVPGPIISFRIGGSELSGAVRPALDQIKREARSASQQIADDWRRMAAQIRATTALGSGTEQEITRSRKELVATLDKEIAGLRTRNELTKQELASLKAQTLERERQVDAMKRGVTIGLTGGTSSALNQVSTQTVLGVTRVLDSLVNRYLGGAAGAAFRTVRDVGYYSSLTNRGLSGAGVGGEAGTAAGGGILGGISSTFGGVVDAVGPATIAVAGFTTALTAAGVAAAGVTLSLAKENEHFENLAQQTGFSSQQIQIFGELAKEMGLDVNGLVSSVDRFQFSLAEYQRKGAEGANVETQRTIDALQKLGIEVESKPGQLRPAIDVLTDLSETLRAIPDPGKRSQEALDVLGIRGRELTPYLLSAKGSLGDLLGQIEKTGPIIDKSMSAKLEVAKSGWDDLTRSIAKNALILKEWTVNEFLDLFTLKGAPQGLSQDQQATLNKVQKAGQRPLSTGESFYIGTPADTAALIKQAEIIAGKTELQGQLEEKRKELNSAIALNQGEEAVELAKSVNYLEQAVKWETERTRLMKEYKEHLVGVITLPAAHAQEFRTLNQQVHGTTGGIFGPFSAPQLLAPELPVGIGGGLGVGYGEPGSTALPASITSGLDSFTKAGDLLKQISDEHDDIFTTQREKDAEHYADEFKDLNDALSKQLISQQQYSDAVTKLKQDEAKTLLDADKKYTDEAGKLFDDLISGNAKKFGKAFEKDILEAVLAPIKKIFSEQFGGILANLTRSVSIPFGGSAGSGTGAAAGGGSWLQKIFGVFSPATSGIGPGGTAGIFPGVLGIGGSHPGTGVAGQLGVATMSVTAGVVNLTGQLGLPGTGPLSGGGATGNFFGNLNPFSAGSGSVGAGPIGSAEDAGYGYGSSASGGSTLSSLGPYLAGGALLGLGLASKNTTAAILGASQLGSAALKSISTSLGTGSALGQGLGKIAPGLPGVGLYAAGVAQGGVGGTLEATLGGAQAGAAFGGPIGAAIGAGVGLISGVVSSLIQGPSFAQRVKQDMKNQQYTLPPSETFSFAMGSSIGQTLSTGAAQSGSTFSSFGLAANTPFWANPVTGPLSKQQQRELAEEQMGLISNQPFLGLPGTDPFTGQGPVGRRHTAPGPQTNITIQAMDSQSFSDFVSRNGNNHVIAKIAGSLGALSSSGFGNNVRRVANLP